MREKLFVIHSSRESARVFPGNNVSHTNSGTLTTANTLGWV